MNIQSVPIGQCKTWARNPRKIEPKDFERLKKQIQKLKPYKPLLAVKENEHYTILGGNMRLKALKELGHEQVFISIVDAQTEKQKLEYALSDNDAAGRTDIDLLGNLLIELPTIDLDTFKVDIRDSISLDQALDQYNAKHLPDNIDDIPEKIEPKCKTGDLWQLGKHRLLVGDATKKDDVEKLMNGKETDMVFTDPPYGVSYSDKNKFLNSFQKAGRNLNAIINDNLSKDELFQMLTQAFSNACEIGADHCSYYVTAPQGGELGLMMMMMMMMNAGLPIRHVLIWVKNHQNFSLGRLDYEYKHEPILYTWKKTHYFYGEPDCSVWQINKPRHADLHPTMKPVELCARAIKNSSQQNNIILDLFGGSGSTLIACEQLDRRCRMIEIDPKYCDIIIARFEAFTGKTAVKLE